MHPNIRLRVRLFYRGGALRTPINPDRGSRQYRPGRFDTSSTGSHLRVSREKGILKSVSSSPHSRSKDRKSAIDVMKSSKKPEESRERSKNTPSRKVANDEEAQPVSEPQFTPSKQPEESTRRAEIRERLRQQTRTAGERSPSKEAPKRIVYTRKSREEHYTPSRLLREYDSRSGLGEARRRGVGSEISYSSVVEERKVLREGRKTSRPRRPELDYSPAKERTPDSTSKWNTKV